MTNTIPNVPRELLDSLLTVIESNGYAADEVEVVDELLTLLSAPSPAGVGGLEVVSNWVLFDAEADKPYIKKMLPEGFLAFFDCEEDARRAKANNPGADYKRIDRVKAEDAQAVIDRLRGEVADLHTTMMAAAVEIQEHWAAQYGYSAETLVRLESQRDQQAQRIGELEGLLREAHDTYRAAIHWEDLRGTMKCIDAALSARGAPK